MGLASGDHGVKTTCKTIFSDSYRDFQDLVQARTALEKSPKQTCVILDGNVMLKNVPMALWSYRDHFALFRGSITRAFQAADTVIVLFDDNVTKAKKFEQDRRDRSRNKGKPVVSHDLKEEACPSTDCYTLEQINDCVNIHHLYDERAARPRLVDMLCKGVMEGFIAEQRNSMRRFSANSSSITPSQSLIFDGVDCRGGDREFGVSREAGFYCNDASLDDRLERKQGEHVGEGDCKFSDLQYRIARLKQAGKAFTNIELVILTTIDTDSIGIELMRHARDEYMCFQPPFETLLAFRERPPKRRADEAACDVVVAGSYSTFHTKHMYKLILAAIFGDELDATKHMHPHAMLLLVTMWALGGSDFSKQPGMRADISIEAMCSLCADDIMALEGMTPVLKLARHGAAATSQGVAAVRPGLLNLIKKGVQECAKVLSTTPRLKAASHKASNFIVSELKKASFVTLYWVGVNETVLDENLETFGF